jgi:hypothetical protein
MVIGVSISDGIIVESGAGVHAGRRGDRVFARSTISIYRPLTTDCGPPKPFVGSISAAVPKKRGIPSTVYEWWSCHESPSRDRINKKF